MSSLTVSLGLDAAGFISGLRNADQAAERGAASLAKAFKASANSQKGLTDAAIEQRSQTLRNLGVIDSEIAKFAEAARSTRAYKQELASLGDKYRGNAAALNQHIAAFGQQNGLLSLSTIRTRELAAEQQVAAAKANNQANANKNLSGSIGGVISQMRSFAAVMGVGFGIAGLKQASDEWTTLTNRLKLVTNSTQEVKVAQEGLVNIAVNTGQALGTVGSTYQSIARNQQALGLSSKEVLRLTETISKAMVIGGGTTEGNAAALLQLGQAFSSGVLRGQEFNSIMEQAPGLAKALADGLGVPIGKLRGMAETGQLTSDVVLRALQKMASSIDTDFSKMNLTISQSTEVLKTRFTEFIGKSNDASGAASTLSKSIVLISEHIGLLVSGVGALVAVQLVGWFVRTTASVVVNTASIIANAAAARAAGAAHVGFAQAMTLSEAAAIRGSGGVLSFSQSLGVLRGGMSSLVGGAARMVAPFTAILAPIATAAAAIVGLGAAVLALYETYLNWDKGGDNFISRKFDGLLDTLGIIDSKTQSLGTAFYDAIHNANDELDAKKILKIAFTLLPSGPLANKIFGQNEVEIKAKISAAGDAAGGLVAGAAGATGGAAQELSKEGTRLAESIKKNVEELEKERAQIGRTREEMRLLEMQAALSKLRNEQGSSAAVKAAEADIAKAKSAIEAIEVERKVADEKKRNQDFVNNTVKSLAEAEANARAEFGKSENEIVRMRLAAAGASSKQLELARASQGVIDKYRQQQAVMATLNDLRYQAKTAGMDERERTLYDLKQKGASSKDLAEAGNLLNEKKSREDAARMQQEAARSSYDSSQRNMSAADTYRNSSNDIRSAGDKMLTAADSMQNMSVRERNLMEVDQIYQRNKQPLEMGGRFGTEKGINVSPSKSYKLEVTNGSSSMTGTFITKENLESEMDNIFASKAQKYNN